MKFSSSVAVCSLALVVAILLCTSLSSEAHISTPATTTSLLSLPEYRDAERVYQSNSHSIHQRNVLATEFRGGAIKKKAAASKKANKKKTAVVFTGPNVLEKLPVDALTGIVFMGLLDALLKKVFQSANINFPSMLGGCMLLFVVAVGAETVHPGWGDAIESFLTPGSALLAKWLPAFFVPGLAMLPLAPSMGTGLDIAKALVTVVVGLVYSMTSVSFTVLAMRKAQGANNAPPAPAKKKLVRSTKKAVAPSPKPFSKECLEFLSVGTAALLVACVAALRMDNPVATPLQTLALIFATLFGFVAAVRGPASFNKVVHPLITSSAVTVAVVQLIAKGTGSDLKSVLKSYKVGSLNPMKMGAGDALLWILGPSVVSFAVSMYSRKTLIYENLLVILIGVAVASAGGLFATAAFVRAINVGNAVPRLSLLPRNITTALAMVIADLVGGDISQAAVCVVFTGVIGASFGKYLLAALGIHDPVTRGMGMGGSAQGLGVSAMSNEPDAFPFAAIAMVLTAVASTVIVSIPGTRDALIKLATGDITAAAAAAP